MTRHLLVVANARSADLQLEVLDTSDLSVRPVGRLPVPGAAGAGDACPMALRGKRLWLAWRGARPMILAFEVDLAEPSLRPLGAMPVADGLCHLSVAADGARLFGAGGDAAIVAALDSHGCPTVVAQRLPVGALAHCIVVQGRTALATACRDDRLVRFSVAPDTGVLTERDSIAFPKGSGPRHIVIAAAGDRAYVVTETSAEIVTIALGETLQIVSSVSLLEAGVPGQAADLVWSSDRSCLFASERATNQLFRLPVDAVSGAVERREAVATPDCPRAIHVDASGAFAVALGFRGHQAIAYAVDRDGMLRPRTSFATGERPSSIVALPLD